MIFPVAVSVVVLLLLAWHISVCCDYPYYFIWDMDYIASLETVLIQSGLRPDHICHPGFGMNFFLFFSEKIAEVFGVLSVLNLDDVAASLNPLAGMAELTAFVRLHSPFLSVGIGVLLCMAIYRIFDISRWYLLFFLVFLGAQESLTYHSSMVRTEFYSVFYWSGAVLAMAIAAKSSSSIGRFASLLATGLLLGLSLLTKIQSLFYLAVLPVLAILVFSFFQDVHSQQCRAITRKGVPWLLAVSLFNVIAFLFLGIASHLTPIPPGIPTWAAAFRVTPIFVIFFLALLGLFLCQLFSYRTDRISSDVFRSCSFLSIIAAGFILSFAFHFLLYSDGAVSLNYMLLNFKMMFLREPKLLKITEPSAYISNFLSFLYYNPLLFIVNIVLNVLLVLGHRFRFVRITKSQLALCLVTTCLAFVNIAVGTRFILRDILWAEVLLNFLSLFYFSILLSRATRYRPILIRLGGGLLVVLFFVNCAHAANMPERIDANFNHYGWRQDKWFSWVYGGNQRRYEEIIRKKYNAAAAWIAGTKAADHKRIRRTVDFVFKNQPITHRNIGIVFEGFSAWSADSDYRITEVPPALRGDILADNASVGLKQDFFFREEHVKGDSEYLNKFRKPSSGERISVLTRRDLQIFLFVQPDDVSALVSEVITQTPYKIVLRNNKQTIRLQGLEIKNYCEIPLAKITRKYFFVIHQI